MWSFAVEKWLLYKRWTFRFIACIRWEAVWQVFFSVGLEWVVLRFIANEKNNFFLFLKYFVFIFIIQKKEEKIIQFFSFLFLFFSLFVFIHLTMKLILSRLSFYLSIFRTICWIIHLFCNQFSFFIVFFFLFIYVLQCVCVVCNVFFLEKKKKSFFVCVSLLCFLHF